MINFDNTLNNDNIHKIVWLAYVWLLLYERIPSENYVK